MESGLEMRVLVAIILLPFFLALSEGVVLDKYSEDYVKLVVSEFERQPSDSRFQNIVEPPLQHNATGTSSSTRSQRAFFLPRILLWCPLTQYRLNIVCPLHAIGLHGGQWTDVLYKMGPRNPRLVFDVGENILLVQRFYFCKAGHRYLSTSPEIMHLIPSRIRLTYFPVRIFHKTACTLELIDMVNSWVCHGVNFLQMVDSIANMNYKTYYRKLNRYIMSCSEDMLPGETAKHEDDFCNNLMFGFPGVEKLIHIFLDDFSGKEAFYVKEMGSKIARLCLSTDHTFKISKSVGTYREFDNKFVKQFENLFIIMNEDEEVLGWRLTKSTAHDEVRDLLEEVNSRLKSHNVNLEYIVVDKCCGSGGEAKFYQSIFGMDVPIKLDLFHAVQRVLQPFKSKKSQETNLFGKEFGLIFRENGDFLGKRKAKTAEPHLINEHLDDFLLRWNTALNTYSDSVKSNVLKEIEKLRVHIDNECLSGLRPGSGTECNERLHRLLNRSVVTGASNIGPELLHAILTILFYVYNSRKKGQKHTCNSRIVPSLPIESSLSEFITAEQTDFFSVKSSAPKFRTGTLLEQEKLNLPDSRKDVINTQEPLVIIVNSIQDVLCASVFKTILKQARQQFNILSSVQKQCKRRDYNAFNAQFTCFSNINMLHTLKETTIFDETVEQRRLERNLVSFGLAIDSVKGDGDCAFRSVIRQLYKALGANSAPEFSSYEDVLRRLGLSLVNEDDDTFTLRQLFVDTLLSNPVYSPFMLQSELSHESIRQYRQPGIWASSIGDLVLRVCSDLLKIAIFVISSSSEMTTVPFIPHEIHTDVPLYVAYTPGHYSGTNKADRVQDLQEEKSEKGCSCGKNSKMVGSCIDKQKYRTRCVCFKEGKKCTRICLCRNCLNKECDVAETANKYMPTRCSCGKEKSRQNTEFKACCDVEGQRKTRCPCFSNGQRCSFSCICFNCCNDYGVNKREQVTLTDAPKKRSRSMNESHKRKRGTEFLAMHDCEVKDGPWMRIESICLVICINFMSRLCITPTLDNLVLLYNELANSAVAKEMNVGLRTKSKSQIIGKMRNIEASQKVQLNFFDHNTL